MPGPEGVALDPLPITSYHAILLFEFLYQLPNAFLFELLAWPE